MVQCVPIIKFALHDHELEVFTELKLCLQQEYRMTSSESREPNTMPHIVSSTCIITCIMILLWMLKTWPRSRGELGGNDRTIQKVIHRTHRVIGLVYHIIIDLRYERSLVLSIHG